MKKQTLVTNQRDKNLLIVLAIAIVIFLSYYFIIDPALQKGSLLSQEVGNTETELTRVTELIAQFPTLKQEELKQKSLLVDKYKVFFCDLNQERILYKLDSLIVGSGFSVATYTPTPAVAAPITFPAPQFTPMTYPLLDLASKSNLSLIPSQAAQSGSPQPAATAATDNTQPVDPAAEQPAAEQPAADTTQIATEAIPTTDITLTFSQTSFEATMAFVKSLENMDKSVIVRNVDITKVGTAIDGQVVLSMYALPKLDDSDKDLLKFLPVIPQGKANPFN